MHTAEYSDVANSEPRRQAVSAMLEMARSMSPALQALHDEGLKQDQLIKLALAEVDLCPGLADAVAVSSGKLAELIELVAWRWSGYDDAR
jgi:hypothetical protein